MEDKKKIPYIKLAGTFSQKCYKKYKSIPEGLNSFVNPISFRNWTKLQLSNKNINKYKLERIDTYLNYSIQNCRYVLI